LIRTARWIAGILIAGVLAVVIGAVPVPVGIAGQGASASEDSETVRIYVLSNGFHSDIAIPNMPGLSLDKLGVSRSDFPVPADAVRYWAIGWGSKTAYTSLLAVSDLTPSIVMRALAFDRSVMHIQPLGEIAPQPGVYAYDLAKPDYARMMSQIRRSFGDEIRPIADVTQGFGDRFYEGAGRFSPIRGCNVWTGRRLRDAGIGVGLWTLFAQSLEFGLSRTSVAHQAVL
jgi:uncharacterized protein (TIGR02117 family)